MNQTRWGLDSTGHKQRANGNVEPLPNFSTNIIATPSYNGSVKVAPSTFRLAGKTPEISKQRRAR
jgi:hypothetical protein